MKHIKFFVWLSVISGCLTTATSCDNFQDMNSSPNSIIFGETPAPTLLQNLIYDGNWVLSYRSWRINGDLMQYSIATGAGSQTVSNFVLSASEFGTVWNSLAASCMNAEHMAYLGALQADANSEAIALTLKAFYVAALTDIYGDIPYTEAFQCADKSITQPKYDLQGDIYTSLCDDLRRADTLYDTSAEYKGAEYDLLYGGDMKKWRKFTNALRLRLLMRQTKQRDVSAELNEIYTGSPLFASNDEAAILHFTGITPFFNGFGPSGSLSAPAASQNKRLCSRLIDLLLDTDDPRLYKYAEPYGTANGEPLYGGILSGYGDDYQNDNIRYASNFSKTLSTDTAPSTFMSYAEQQFILSEAAARGYIAADARTLYESGVTASIREWCGDEAQTQTVLTSARGCWDGTIERIIEQKWVSLFMVGMESWCDYRRTGYPTLVFGPACVNKDAAGEIQMPTRFCYPTISQTTNAAQYAVQVERMGGKDDMLTAVWWAEGDNY